MTITRIKKRDGRIVPFDREKITEAIWKAARSVGGADRSLAEKISGQVVNVLDVFFKDERETPTVEQIQDLVEKILIENNHARTAKAYILYRQKHAEIREQKEEILGLPSDTKFSLNAIKVLEQRYLLRDERGNVIETPEQMIRRVAHNIALADSKYAGFDPAKSEEEFFAMMIGKDFLPNSPTLMNAGAPVQQLAACFVLPIGDSIPEIFESMKNTAIIQQSGGGTGFNFSRLRPRGDIVSSTKGISSGPVSFMRIFDTLTSSMKEGGKRRGANMGILNINHPDILEFITCKEREGEFANFNISVGITDKFMKAVENDLEYDLVNPHTGKTVNKLNARSVFELIVARAWANGEPGIVFIDRLEEGNPTPKIGKIDSTNPCGEQPLLPYEACNLGSINVANFVTSAADNAGSIDNTGTQDTAGDMKSNIKTRPPIDWGRLKQTVHSAIHFLDNVIDVCDYKLPEIKEVVTGNRKIGLGIMGFADLLFRLKIAYDSEDGIRTAGKLMEFIEKEARTASEELGRKKGSFPNFKESVFPNQGFKEMRNATVTTIAPAGTLSMIADTSSGIEPLYAVVFTKHVLDGTELLYVNPYFEEELKKSGIHSRDLMRKISKTGSIREVHEIPAATRKIFVVASDISPEWHIRMQAAFQKNTDNAVSKTINFPSNATIEDVKRAYVTAYKLACKGLTIYRDTSRESQVLTHSESIDFTIDPNQAQLPLKIETAPSRAQKPRIINKPEEIIPPPVSGNQN